MTRPQTFTIRQTAQILGICLTSAYEAVRRGEIPVLTIGKTKRVPRMALEEMLLHGDNWRKQNVKEGQDATR